jgi:eukaryotic-like serine/threonine-protein kinase
MQPGDVVGARFEILRSAGSGGMGEVFQARDRARDALVAVKVLLDRKPNGRARFEREAEALSELRHPGIVQYVAHGETDTGEPYLVMEWLEGEDLAERLKRGPLTIDEGVTLGLRVAETLGAAHARGIVHRDLKPSNLFLVGGRIDGVKVLDFGIAWLADTTRMTETGIVLGTPGYMAPEQTRTGAEIDARADVFSLGCVLFECLTGRQTFTGDHVMMLLAKILFEEVPRVSDLAPEVPTALSALVHRMLKKDPAARPRDGLDVAEALSARGAAAFRAPLSAPLETAGEPTLGPDERRLLSIVIVGRPSAASVATTQRLGVAATSSTSLAMRKSIEASFGRFELLVDGSALVTLTGAGMATDLAARAARCALTLRAMASPDERPVALATGHAEATFKLPLGDVLERAACLLPGPMPSTSPRVPPSIPASIARAVAIDELTAGLLDERFDVRRGARGPELHGELAPAVALAPAPGEAPCVGRDRELATLRALFRECVEEPVARVAIVTAGVGMGKTRLARELLREMREGAHGGYGAPVTVWFARGEAPAAAIPFGLLGQLLRGAADIDARDPPSAWRAQIEARFGSRLSSVELRALLDLLEGLTGPSIPVEAAIPGDAVISRDAASAARPDPALLGELLRRALGEIIAAECAARPLLIVLDDMHWGDLATARLLGAVLGERRALPWMVTALARPEIHATFPRLWVERDAQQIRLDKLTRRAGERLVRKALGEEVPAADVERIIAMADGNARHLMALVAAARGEGPSMIPEPLVAMTAARLEVLEAEARRVLRAASLFGEAFCRGGVEALTGGAQRGSPVGEWLSLLVEREILVRHPTSRFPGEEELAFRHPLLRAAAHAMLTDEDRALGRRLVDAFVGERRAQASTLEAQGSERSSSLAAAPTLDDGEEG